MAILLSICIPTHNRAQQLDITLKHFVQEDAFLNTDDIEIIISDNASEDNTKEVCEYFVKQFPDKIRYYRHEQNIGNDNFPFILNQARGKYAKLNNDTCYFTKDKFSKFVDIIKDNPEMCAFFITNKKKESLIVKCNNADDFFKETSHWNTWIAGFCVQTDLFRKVENPTKYAEKKLCQVDILGRLIKNQKSIVVNDSCLYIQQVNNKKGYNVAEIFGQNYCIILKDLISQGIISENTYNSIRKSELTEHLNYQYFDIFREFHFSKNGYFKYLLPYYKYDLYFYIQLVKYFLLDFLFKFDITLKICDLIKNVIRRHLWRKKNHNNKTQMGIPLNIAEHNRIYIGDETQGIINVQFNNNPNSTLTIGKNCIISKNTLFVFDDNVNGNITIGNHVYIGKNTIIRSNTNIPDNSRIEDN